MDDEVINKYYDEVREIVLHIRSLSCPNCDSKASIHGRCRHCDNENPQLVDDLKK